MQKARRKFSALFATGVKTTRYVEAARVRNSGTGGRFAILRTRLSFQNFVLNAVETDKKR